jgi:hypothetical protein
MYSREISQKVIYIYIYIYISGEQRFNVMQLYNYMRCVVAVLLQ